MKITEKYNHFIDLDVEKLPEKIFKKPYFANQKQEYIFGEQLPLPKIIMLETCSWCNLNCEFCPSSKLIRPKKLINDDLFQKIIDDLANLNYSGNLQLFYSNEPLLDSKIFERIKYASLKLKNSQIGIFTNGILLSDKILDDLIESGITYMMVDIYTSDHHYEKVKNMMELQTNKRSNIKFYHEKVTLYSLKTIYDDTNIKLFLFDRYVKKTGEDNRTNKINYTTKLETIFIDNKKEDLKNTKCFRLLTQLIITFNGKVLTCCEEWTFESTIGDLNKNSIHEIWNSDKFNEIRYKLQEQGRSFYPCNSCNYYGGETDKIFKIKK